MLERVLEPEVMDSLADALDYDAMDHREVNQRFVADLLAASLAPRCAAACEPIEVLDLGTGPAQIPIELCLSEPNVRVVAVDLAASMLDLARRNIEIALLTDRIMLDRVDAKALRYDDDLFACVMSNSIIHHLTEPRAALAESLRVLAPGGLIFFRDLARPASNDEWTALVEKHAGAANPRQRQLFADSLRAALTLDEIRRMVQSLGAPPKSVQMTSDRHWTWCWIKPHAPV